MELKNIHVSKIFLLETGFEELQQGNLSGIIHRTLLSKLDLNSLKPTFNFKGNRINDLHVKSLDAIELRDFPIRRFSNSLYIWYKTVYPSEDNSLIFQSPRPRALIFKGNLNDYLFGNINEAYFVSDYIEGENLLKQLDDNKKNNRAEDYEHIFNRLRSYLSTLLDEHIIHLDFAPRDTIIHGEYKVPVLVDTEHVYIDDISVNTKTRQDVVEMQKNQFLEDYSLFFSKKELEKIMQYVFPRVNPYAKTPDNNKSSSLAYK